MNRRKFLKTAAGVGAAVVAVPVAADPSLEEALAQVQLMEARMSIRPAKLIVPAGRLPSEWVDVLRHNLANGGID